MAWFMFVDESGHDRMASPYEVLAGVAVEERVLWSLIVDLQEAEERFFGQRITRDANELKARKLLKRKTYRLAGQLPEMEPAERRVLVESLRTKGGQNPTRREITAMAQAKLAFVEHVFDLCARHQVVALASIVDKAAPRSTGRDFPRKDYAYLFERFYYHLMEQPSDCRGIVVFDEVERSQCHVLVNQLQHYFQRTQTGRLRAGRVVPEPLFVHSELTSLVQVADLVAYILSWGFRLEAMTRPRRAELQPLVRSVIGIRRLFRDVDVGKDEPIGVWSFTYLDDLRPLEELLVPG